MKDAFLQLEVLNKKISNRLWKADPTPFVVREPNQDESDYEYMKSIYNANINKMVTPARQIWRMSHWGIVAEYNIRKFLGLS